MGMAPSVAELRKLSDSEIEKRYNDLAKSTVVGTAFYLEELHRREADRREAAMIRMTAVMMWLTIAVTVLTVVNVWAVFRAN